MGIGVGGEAGKGLKSEVLAEVRRFVRRANPITQPSILVAYCAAHPAVQCVRTKFGESGPQNVGVVGGSSSSSFIVTNIVPRQVA